MGRLDASWKAASKGRPQLALLTGRRRVGKTALVAAFADQRRSVIYTATREAMPAQLARFAERLAAVGTSTPIPSTFATWHEAFEFAAAIAQREPLLVGIDEVPYLTEVESSFGSIVQAAWDRIAHNTKPPKLMMLLTGSSRRVMTRLTAGGGPLFGRADLNLRLEPFALEEIGPFLRRLSPENRLMAYAVTGGYPRHLLAWDDAQTLAENISSLVQPGSILYDDAPLIVNEEFPTGLGFERVLLAIGRGRHAYGEIKTEADLRIETPIATLEQVGLIRGETPNGGPRRAAPHYVITDPYLRFWFGPLARIRQSVELGSDAAQVLTAGVWSTHLGSVFEDEARRHAIRLCGKGELPPATVGRWWRMGRNPIELDIIGRAEDRVVFAGEAKWSESIAGTRELASLKSKADAAFGQDPNRLDVLWSRRKVRAQPTHNFASYSVSDLVT